LDITGRVGVGITNPTADIDLNTIRIRQSILDTNSFSGNLGYFLTNDATGVKWVAVPPLNNNALFISQNDNILGPSSYTGINFVSDGNDLVAISTNTGNTKIVDVRINSYWNKSGNTGIYTSKFVGIGSTTPTVALDVIGDGKFSGIVTAGKFSGQSGIITGSVEVGSLTVTGVSTFIGVTTFSKVGIGSTTIPRATLDVGGDVWVSGAVTAISFTAENFYGTISTAKYADLAGIATNISLASTTSTDSTSYLVLVGSSGTTIQQPFIDSQSLSYDSQTNTLNSDNIKVGFITATNAWIGIATIDDLKSTIFRVGTAITMSNGIISATTFRGRFLDFENLNVSGIATINTGIVTNLNVSGITTINTGIVTSLRVTGVSTFVGLATFTSIGIGTTGIIGSDVLTIIGDTRLGGNTNIFRVGTAITMSNGIISATTFRGRFLDFENLNVSGITTINTGIVTSLRVTGVSTFVGLATFTSIGIGTTGIIGSDVLTIIGDTRLGGNTNIFRVGTAITMSNGIVTATTFSGKLLDFENLNVSGIATVGSGLTGVVINAGIITSISGFSTITFVGNLTGTASTASFATTAFNLNSKSESQLNVSYASTAGIATFAQTAGIATNVIGGIASVTSLFVNTTGISTFGGSDGVLIKYDGVSGIVTSANPGVTTVTYYGDGSKLTGIGTAESATNVALTTDTSSTTTNIIFSQTPNQNPTSSLKSNPSLIFNAATSSLGIGTTNPLTPLQVEKYGVKTGFGTFVASAGITTDVDSFVIATNNFKTAEYTVYIESSSSIQAQKVLVMQNGTSAFSQEYAIMYEPTFMVSIGATVSGGLCKLQFTPESGISGLMTYRFARETMI
jgi:hypothetical protein